MTTIEKTKQAEIKDCYTITEIQKKFNISNGTGTLRKALIMVGISS